MTLPNLPLEIIEQIALFLPLSSLVSCKLVCKDWKEVLSSQQFCKKYTLDNHDCTEGEPTHFLKRWLDPEMWSTHKAFGRGQDKWVFAKPPKEWNCGIVHPADLKPKTDDTIKFSDFLVAMTKLDKLKKGADEFEIDFVGWGNEGGCITQQPVLIPWSKESLPRDDDIFDIFQFNPEMRSGCNTFDINGPTKLEPETLCDEYDESNKIVWRCLACYQVTYDAHEFFQFLRRFFCPAVEMCIACEVINPVPVFLLTKLAPGWVGGYMAGIICT